MYIIESRHFKDEHLDTTLCVQGEKVVIQQRDKEDIILEEWFFPFYNHGDSFETCLVLDEKKINFIKKSPFVIIHENFFETNEIKIKFDQGEYILWDTFVPELTCITQIPELPEIRDPDVFIEILDQEMIIGELYYFRTIKTFFTGKVKLSFLHLQDIFKEHTGKICKLYVSQDSPLCIEFFNGHRIFIAPMFS